MDDFRLNATLLDSLIDGLEQQADDLCEETAYQLRNGMQISMSGPKSGRFYGTHQASAAGESPAVRTGGLKNNIPIEKPESCVRIVTVGQEYGPYLEMGTRYMAARPFVGPEVERLKPVFDAAIGGLFNVK